MSDDILSTIDAPTNGDILEIANDLNVEQQDLYFYRYAEYDVHDTQSEPEEDFESFVEETIEEFHQTLQIRSARRRSRSVGSRSHFYDILHSQYQSPRNVPSNEETAASSTPVQPNSHENTEVNDTFALSLRSDVSTVNQPKIKKPTVTRPQPFNIKVPKRFEQGATANRVSPSLAEAVERWNLAIPARFHTLGRNQKPPITHETKAHRITTAKTPPLASLQRQRPANYPGREVLEQQEMEAIRKNGFKAHPIPKGVFTPPEPKETKRVLPMTIPQTPKFSEAGKASLRAAASNRNISASTSTLSEAGSTSSGGNDTRPRTTEVHPFSFEQRDKRILQAKQQKIKKIIEEERKQAEFHANPLPAYMQHSHTQQQQQHRPRTAPQTTQAVPFQLSTEARLGQLAQRRKEKEEEERRKENAAFKKPKPKPATVLNRDPFKPLPAEEKQLTQAVGFHLSTEERAAKRKEFDQYLKERDLEYEQVRKEREERKKKREEEEIARLRRQAEFKAHPIHHYKPAEEIPRPELTVPVTPKFCRK